ncbi:DUF6766 family protein [Brevundimonas faecalis]|uniref:Uncharacterized protein n=1 Tax=Brevundimonas faecalis TaxID=947378 RepID=A0ABV2R7Z9_9CAUL
MKKYAYAWITLAFFTISILLHWVFGWFAYVNDAQSHGEAAQLGPYLVEMGRDTFENWQSEFLQLLWQVVGLAYFLYVGSPSSKENDDRMEAKMDALLELVGQARGLALIEEIDASHLRRHGHASMHLDPPYGERGAGNE